MRHPKYGEAAVFYREALRLAPDDVASLLGLGSAVEELGRPDEAIELYRRAMRIAPDDARTPHYLSGVLRAKGRLEEAAERLGVVLRLQPQHSGAAAALERVHAALAERGPAAVP